MRKKMIVAAFVIALMLTQAAPALALSSISNSFSTSRTYWNTGNSGTFHSQTNYGQVGLYNPYTSDYYTALNYRHFNQPTVTGWSGFGSKPAFGYITSSPKTGGDPAWRYNSGTFWVFSGVTKYINFSSTAKSASRGWKKSAHGQYNIPMVSYGPDAILNTYHY